MVNDLNKLNLKCAKFPWWVYIFLLGFLISWFIVIFADKWELIFIPLIFMVLYFIFIFISCYYSIQVYKGFQQICEEYRVKLRETYILKPCRRTAVFEISLIPVIL